MTFCNKLMEKEKYKKFSVLCFPSTIFNKHSLEYSKLYARINIFIVSVFICFSLSLCISLTHTQKYLQTFTKTVCL